MRIELASTAPACVCQSALLKPRFGLVLWVLSVSPSVAAMGIVMALNDDPNGSAGKAAVLSILGLVFLVLAVAHLRTAAAETRTPPTHRGGAGIRLPGRLILMNVCATSTPRCITSDTLGLRT